MGNVVYRVEDERYRLSIYVDEYAESPRAWDNLATMVCSHRRYNLGDEQAENIDKYSSWDEWLQGEVYDLYGEDNVVCLPLYLYDHSGITMNTTGFLCSWDSGQVGWIYATKEKFRKETLYTEAELFSKDPYRIPSIGERIRIEQFGTDWGQVIAIDVDTNDGSMTFTVDFDYNKALNYRRPERVVDVGMEEIVEVRADMARELLRNEVEIYDMYLRGNVYGFCLEQVKKCNCCGNIDYTEVDSCWGFYEDDLKQLVEYMKYEVSEEVRYMFDKLK